MDADEKYRKPPLISVIMLCYNGAPFLSQAIASVRAQTHERWELLFLDDGSSDESLETARSFSDPRIRIFELRHTGNPGKLRNIGVKEARGEFVAFLDSDDSYFPGALTDLLAALQGGAAAACGLRQGMSTSGEALDLRESLPRHDLQSLLLGQTIANLQSYLFAKEALEKVGDFDETLNHRNDLQLLIRLQLRFPDGIRLVPRTVFRYRIRVGSLSHDIGTLEERLGEGLRMLDWAAAQPGLSDLMTVISSRAYATDYAAGARACRDLNQRRLALRQCWLAWRDPRVAAGDWLRTCLRQFLRALLPNFADRAAKSLLRWGRLARARAPGEAA